MIDKKIAFIISCIGISLIMCTIGITLSAIVCYILLNKVVYEVSLMYGLMLASTTFLYMPELEESFEEAWDTE